MKEKKELSIENIKRVVEEGGGGGPHFPKRALRLNFSQAIATSVRKSLPKAAVIANALCSLIKIKV
jgi:hypothetical protein